MCLLVVLYAYDVEIPFGADELPGMLPLPRVAELLILATVAIAAAALAVAAAAARSWPSRLLVLPFALLAVAVGGELRDVGRQVGEHSLLMTGGLVVAGLALVPVVLAVLPRGGALRRPWLLATAAALPFATIALLYAAAGDEAYRLPASFVAQNPDWPDVIAVREAVAKSAVDGALLPAAFALNLLLLWQVIEAARLTRDAAAGGLRLGARARRLLLWALGAKLAFLAVGYLGALPWSGGADEAFGRSREDGLLSWLLALLIVGGGLVYAWPRVSERNVRRAAIAALVGLTLATAVIGVLAVLRAITDLAAYGAVGRALDDALIAVADASPWILALWPLLLAAAGAALLVRRQIVLGAGLLIFAAWALPRSVTLMGDLAGYAGTDIPVGRPGDYIEGDEQYPGWVDAVTLDAVLTLALVALAAGWRRGGRGPVPAHLLLFCLLLSTVVAHAGALIPGNWRSGAWFYLGLVFPVAYAFLLGARPLNRRRSGRELRLLAVVGTTAFILAVTTLRVFNGDVRPGATSQADVGKVLLQVPLVFLLGLVAVSALRRGGAARETPGR